MPPLFSIRFPLLLLAFLPAFAAGAKPVEFTFAVAPNPQVENPFARELWAEVVTPAGLKRIVPAFHVGQDRFAVRVRAEERGRYVAGRVFEGGAEARALVASRVIPPAEVEVATPATLPQIQRDPAWTGGFVTAAGRSFVPVGTNLAWPQGECVPYYRGAFAAFAREHLNWMRVWMAHWGHLNLDWLPDRLGPAPAPGQLDATVADNWDQLLELAEQDGVYVQLVLQHHGQFSSGVNPEWKGNPWNAANPGGFLRTPAEFFTSPVARQLTRQKYRYVVARWGWSPAVFAWELFNEVHWVDALRIEKNAAAVGAWHSAMAEWIRSLDTYHHLVTTSTDDLRSPVYARMDFYQPHLYPADLIAGVRRRGLPADLPQRPVFYGEVGDDHLDVSDAVKKSGLANIPPVWPALLGDTGLPAQPWLGWDILQQGSIRDLGVVSRFVTESGIGGRRDLAPFTALVEADARVPMEIPGCQVWQRRAAPEMDLPLDGRIPVAFADIPRVYVGAPASVADGYPDHAEYRARFPRPTAARARVVGTGNAKAAIRFLVDGNTVAERSWMPDSPDRPTADRPVDIRFEIPAGPHVLRVENNSGGEWVELAGIELGLEVPALAAIGRRDDAFIAAWVWDRRALLALNPPPAVGGTLVLDDVAKGTWTVTWWDLARGTAGKPATITHAGGTLRVPIPPVERHAAVVLTR